MPRRFLIIAVILAVILIVAIVSSYKMWTSVSAASGMDGHGFAALVIGAVGSLLLGGGLMALVFFSSRRGYDERADPKASALAAKKEP